tara:strand:- start:81 stop:404 length:324 start_codon:yes stop_codon:yes gene_type:complete
MIRIIITILLVGAFFILFFKPKYDLKNKTVSEPSTMKGFIEDTYRGPITDRFIPPKYGDIGTFVSYSTVPDTHWLSGFPQKGDNTIEIPDETPEEKLERRLNEIKYT